MRIPRWLRVILDLALLILLAILFVTGIGLTIAPPGRIARETGWTFLNMDREELGKLHTLPGYIFTGIVIFHFIINWRIFKGCISSLFRKR